MDVRKIGTSQYKYDDRFIVKKEHSVGWWLINDKGETAEREFYCGFPTKKEAVRYIDTIKALERMK